MSLPASRPLAEEQAMLGCRWGIAPRYIWTEKERQLEKSEVGQGGTRKDCAGRGVIWSAKHRPVAGPRLQMEMSGTVELGPAQAILVSQGWHCEIDD